MNSIFESCDITNLLDVENEKIARCGIVAEHVCVVAAINRYESCRNAIRERYQGGMVFSRVARNKPVSSCFRDKRYREQGRYAAATKPITIKDLIKFHGHFCGGLVESAASLRVAFDVLFPDGIIDRTDLRIVSNNLSEDDFHDLYR
jgi:hypothetical protein